MLSNEMIYDIRNNGSDVIIKVNATFREKVKAFLDGVLTDDSLAKEIVEDDEVTITNIAPSTVIDNIDDIPHWVNVTFEDSTITLA